MKFFHHKDLANHLLQLCPKVVKHPVGVCCVVCLVCMYVCMYVSMYLCVCVCKRIFLCYFVYTETLEQVNQFTYLGCSISYQFSNDVESKMAKFLQLSDTIKRTIFKKVRTENILKIYNT